MGQAKMAHFTGLEEASYIRPTTGMVDGDRVLGAQILVKLFDIMQYKILCIVSVFAFFSLVAGAQSLPQPTGNRLQGITVFGFTLDCKQADVIARFGKPIPAHDKLVFRERAGSCYYFLKSGLKVQVLGGPDGQLNIFSSQVEQNGHIIARRGDTQANIAKIFDIHSTKGPWKFLLKSTVWHIKVDSLTVIFDNSRPEAIVKGFLLERHFSVD